MWLIDEQLQANRSTRASSDAYREHREHTTRVALESRRTEEPGTLCVLGAGNCLDLDLPELSRHFSAIHLVDVDQAALEAALAREAPEVRARIVLHAPIDLSGLLDRLERWSRLEVTEEELLAHHTETAQALALELGTYDVVVSASCITQMQLSVLQALGDRHQLFDAVRHVLAATHLHTLHSLTKPGGRALLVTDVLSSVAYPSLAALPPHTDFLQVLKNLMAAEQMIYIARPGLFHLLQREDPTLRARSRLTAPLAAWRWHHSPEVSFLVYAMALDRSA